MKKILFSVLLAMAILWSCGKDDGPATPPVQSKPTITDFDPKTGTVGTVVTITGTNFSTIAADNAVKFGSVAASVVTATATKIVVNVPTGATTAKISVSVSGNTATSTGTFIVTKADTENKSPVMENQEFSVEQTITDTDEIGQIQATDPEGDELTFNIVANDNNLFYITEKGILTLAEGKSLDFESATEHEITIGASDGSTITEVKVTINVLEGDPDNQSPVMEDQEFVVSESITNADEIGQVVATDPDNDTLTFSIADSELFDISDAGVLTLAEGKALDYETETSHSLTVSATDGEETVEATITITVQNVIDSMVEDPTSFITTWQTEANGEEIGFYISVDYEYNFTVDWGDGIVETIDINEVPDSFSIQHEYETAGTYTVAIQGQIPYFSIVNADQGFESRLLSIEQWGKIEWENFEATFAQCSNMVYNAMDLPDLTKVQNVIAMFLDATSFNGDISGWNTANIKSMTFMFDGAVSFDQDLGSWDISSVIMMENMFDDSNMSPLNFSNTLIGWAAQGVKSNIILGAEGLYLCLDDDDGINAFITLTNAPNNWAIISDGVKPCD